MQCSKCPAGTVIYNKCYSKSQRFQLLEILRMEEKCSVFSVFSYQELLLSISKSSLICFFALKDGFDNDIQ
jgi:hypothetical protein